MRFLFPVLIVFILCPLAGAAKTQAKPPADPFPAVFEANKDKIVRLKTSYGTGTGFITTNGLIVTADHVVGTAVYVEMTYNNIRYYMRPCYRDHANDVAVLYPYGYENNRGRFEKIPYDFFKSEKTLSIQSYKPKAGERIMVMGYPYGLLEPKRIFGSFIQEKSRYLENIPLYSCDLSVISGFSGGPVFNADGKVIGIAVKYENQPTRTEYLVSYVSPVKNIEAILTNATPAYLDRLLSIYQNIPDIDLSRSSLARQDTEFIEIENMRLDEEAETRTYISKPGSDNGYYEYTDPSLRNMNIFFNLYMETPKNLTEKDKTDSTNIVDIYIKKKNARNFISLRLDLLRHDYYFVYMVNGNATIKRPYIEMRVIPEAKYNVEITTRGKKMGVFFDNIPVFYDHELPFDSGGTGFSFHGLETLLIENLYLRIPKNQKP